MTTDEQGQYHFLPVRLACRVCGREWPFEQYGEHDGIPAYHWVKCVEHPDAQGRRLCTRCGADSLRCGAVGCQLDVQFTTHAITSFDDPDEKWIVGLCATHLDSEEGGRLSKHFVGPYTATEVAELVAADQL